MRLPDGVLPGRLAGLDTSWLPGTYDERLGECYHLSAKGVALEGIPGVLVHGTIEGAGLPPNPHGWILLDDGSTYDPVLDMVFPPGVHEEWASTTEWVRYDPEEVRQMVRKHGHWGPWGEYEERVEEVLGLRG